MYLCRISTEGCNALASLARGPKARATYFLQQKVSNIFIKINSREPSVRFKKYIKYEEFLMYLVGSL